MAVRYGQSEHTRWQRSTTWSLAALVVGATCGAALPSAWSTVALVVAAAAAGLLVLRGSWSRAAPAVVLCLALLRGVLAPATVRTYQQAEPTVVQAVVANQLDASVGAPESGLAASMLLGAKQGLSQATVEDFRASGLSHLLAVSGYNVTLIANLLLACAKRWLPKRWHVALALVGIVAFVLGTGSSAAVVRAGVVGTLTSLALHSGRTTAAGRALLVAAAAMVLVNPSVAATDVGFQLSFAATAAILAWVPWLTRRLSWLPDVLTVRTSLATTLAATAGTLPIVALTFGRVSLVSIAANVLAAPLVPLTMATSAAAATLGGTPPGLVVGYVASGVLRSLEGIAHVAAQLPGAQLELR